MAVITIDGIQLEVEENRNVLDCALENGIYIPHLCHHKDLNPLGSCRMCIVEVEGQEGLTTSCTLKAKEGMVIKTKSAEIERRRTLALELLLAGHPEDCSTCPKYGNCELQMLIQYIGPKTGRLKLRTKGFKEQNENPLIIHDMNRCVLCGRCVRACNELRGVKVLQYQKKEMETYVGTLHNKLLKDADCRFCGACVEVCPTGTIRDKIRKPDVKKDDAVVPCRYACPAHTDIPRYIRHVKNGEYDEAAAVIREKVPFPRALGYICTHVCELECKRKEISEAMSIRDIKRYAADHDTGSCWKGKGKQLPDTGKKVCVVGGGPAGLTAAYYLRKQGHEVTLKEALPKVGGMMSYGIPSYRLPREIVAQEAAVIEEQGVKMEVNTKVDKPIELLNEYDAVLMAIGGHNGVRLPMEGSKLDGVILNADFLRNASMGKETGMGKRIIVLGGGNVAFDCARTAKRLGAEEIHLACLEAREVMTADDEEIEQAREEGIFVHPAQTFERITGTDKVTGVDFMNVKSFTFDENRRAIIEKEEGSEHHIDGDTVIFAVGQRPDITEEAGLELGRANSIAVKDINENKETSVKGIFAAGDAIYGTKSVIMAIESGREAAIEIDRYLGGDGDISEVLAPKQHADPYIGQCPGFGYLEKKHTVVDFPEKRENNFNLYDHGICDSDICAEAGRCLQCDLRLKISDPSVWGDFVENKEV
jgi:NADPH-dependent glutamate synthase beta subunit-like oxidoreductase/Pyruvate/2-oxoacid:ferredoxin oxidoreductase delta subunit/ferredoxin